VAAAMVFSPHGGGRHCKKRRVCTLYASDW
jgi:hypothetical protein